MRAKKSLSCDRIFKPNSLSHAGFQVAWFSSSALCFRIYRRIKYNEPIWGQGSEASTNTATENAAYQES